MSELPQINEMESHKETLRNQSNNGSHEASKSEAELRAMTGLQVRPGEREDNRWVLYSPDNRPLDQVRTDSRYELLTIYQSSRNLMTSRDT